MWRFGVIPVGVVGVDVNTKSMKLEPLDIVTNLLGCGDWLGKFHETVDKVN